ncbi:hypothetical protein [Herpetosiphon geysericola]|uniref:Uncharacterized protein n=1 Tax=Herpetosiphon geysericola TaxID=70996 RepID=A0A0N8GSU4_9CHLR|nr:hypothetical protein [Herpetosiphon geysericola]KPL90266.1 hypothetical protein SE18_06435 [Herpetosiphon geysericola]
MVEYLIAYAPVQGDAPCAAEAREWSDRAAMEAELQAEGWHLIESAEYRAAMLKLVYQRDLAQRQEAPRHLMPCW